MERVDLPLGPLLGASGRRLLFFVLPGAGAKVPELLRALGRPLGALDLAVLGEGRRVVAPATRTAPGGCAQWARRPTPAHRWLPDAEELLGPPAYACGREAAADRSR